MFGCSYITSVYLMFDCSYVTFVYLMFGCSYVTCTYMIETMSIANGMLAYDKANAVATSDTASLDDDDDPLLTEHSPSSDVPLLSDRVPSVNSY